jgi:hypothetical protein
LCRALTKILDGKLDKTLTRKKLLSLDFALSSEILLLCSLSIPMFSLADVFVRRKFIGTSLGVCSCLARTFQIFGKNHNGVSVLNQELKMVTKVL